MPPPAPTTNRGASTRRFTAAWIAVILLAAILLLSILGAAHAQQPNGAGLVVQHGDGTLIYVYVQFEGDSISGEELLLRSGLEHAVNPYGGLGAAICSLNGEGCPADDCFCQSYSDPAFFWHYYILTADGWLVNPSGISARSLRDGDVDGWSWNASEHSLPLVTIDEIASINGIDRNPPEPTATPTETPLPPPTEPAPTPTLIPTLAPTATAAPPSATQPPAATATSTILATATSVPPTPTATPVLTATATRPPTSTVTSSPAPTEEIAASPIETSSETPAAAAVIVTPGATPQPLLIESEGSSSSPATVLAFASVLIFVVGAGGLLIWRSRRQGVG